MRPRILLPAFASILLLIPSVSVSYAATATVKDGATLELAGGNTFRLDGVTRVMTTTIALETSKGDLPLALGLGIVLITVVLLLNALAYAVREWSVKRHG